jgi:hypothetical protein
MARAERPRGLCPVCGKDCAITEEGGVRHHFTEDPAQQAGPDSRKCRGVGQPPAGANPATPGGLSFLCRVPSGPTGCGHQVQLTANHRARSHLTPHGVSCAEGGSAFPIAVGPDGYRADTAEWTEEQWAEALPKPVRGGEILPAAAPEDLRIEPDRDFDPRPVTKAVETIDLPHDRGPAEPCEHNWGGADVLNEEGDEDQVTACTRCGLLYPEDETGCGAVDKNDMDACGHCSDCNPPALFDPTHTITTDLGPETHPGEATDCRLPGCCTHPGGFTYVDDDNGHSGSFCRVCGVEEPEPELPPEPEPSPVDILDNLDVGVFFVRHTARPPLNRLVYRVQAVTDFCVQVTVVSAGAHAGRTGELTDLSEEITCTDLQGTPRPRRDPHPTPSRPAPMTPARSSAPSSKPSTTASAPRPSASATASSTSETTSAPTAKAATSTPSARKKADVADAFSTPKQTQNESDKYDRYGRYKLRHPVTGKPVNWTRATTYAKSIQDTFALSQWAQRMTLKGAALRPDIVAAVSTLDVKEDRERVNALVEDAKKAAGNKVAANLGTAVHAFTEDRDKALVGIPVTAKAIPDDLRPTVDAYELLLREFGLEPVPGLIEFSTGVVQYEIAGTSDRCYRVTRDITFKLGKRTLTLYAGEYVIGDVKTGADLSYGWLEICIQLAIYAQGLNTSGVWDWNTGTWGKPTLPDNPDVLLKVRTDVALVPHLPVDRKEGADLATLFAIDLDAGWAAAVLCGQVRATRKLGNLAAPLEIANVAESAGSAPEAPRSAPAVASRPVTLEDKARIVTTQEAASAVWKEAVAARTPKAEVDRLVEIMRAKLESLVEKGA